MFLLTFEDRFIFRRNIMKIFQINKKRLSESFKKKTTQTIYVKKNDPGVVSKSAAGTTLKSRSTFLFPDKYKLSSFVSGIFNWCEFWSLL